MPDITPRAVPRTPPEQLLGLAEAIRRREVVFLERDAALWPARGAIFNVLRHARLEDLFVEAQVGAIYGTIPANDTVVRNALRIVHVDDLPTVKKYLVQLETSAQTRAQPRQATAYLVATIRLAADPPIVTRVGTYSEDANSLSRMVHAQTYVNIAKASAPTFAEASEILRREVERNPFWHWMRRLLPPPPPSTVTIP